MDTGSVVGWFDLPAGFSSARLLRTLLRAGYLAAPPAVSRYKCTFVETQDGRLTKQGCRLSIRQGVDGAAWHVSGREGESEGSFEGDVSFRSLSAEAAGIPSTVREMADGRLLFPLVRLKVSAWEARLQSPSGSTLALRAERFTAALPWGGWPKGALPHRLLTVRLLAGEPEAFLHLSTYLRDRLGLPAGSGDACRLALQALGLPEPGAPVPAHLSIRSEDPQALAARKVVGQQVLRMRANIDGTRDDLDPEYLHDLRVANRRLRSALRLFFEVLGPRRCDSLRVELNWVGQLLGAVRDLDVFILNLREQAQRLGEAGTIAEVLAEELGRRRGPEHEVLDAALASRRFRDLMRRLEALASSPLPRRPRGTQGIHVAEAAPALIRKAQKRVLRLGRTIGPDTPAADLHRLRILFKRLRYACEFFREAFADPVSGEDLLADYIQAMVRFQDCLGEHQDAVVAMARVQDLAKDMVQRGALAPERLLDLGGLIQVQREIARDRRGRLAKLWVRFDRLSVRKRLAALEGEASQSSGAGEVSEAVSA
jgi:CHAD domain-containing protein